MEDFLEITKDWWFKKYAPHLGMRLWTFKTALNLILQLGGDSIVETGCIRQVDDYKAGYSTFVFGEFCQKYKKRLHTIDNSKVNLDFAKKYTKEFERNIEYILGDSVSVLKTWDTPIDLLYLDSLDCDQNNEAISKKAQEHCLLELKTAFPNLTRNAIVMIDDNYFENGGKTRLAKEFLREKGFICLLDYYQTLWIRAK